MCLVCQSPSGWFDYLETISVRGTRFDNYHYWVPNDGQLGEDGSVRTIMRPQSETCSFLTANFRVARDMTRDAGINVNRAATIFHFPENQQPRSGVKANRYVR